MIKHDKEKTEKWKNIDAMKGTYCTFEILITKFGHHSFELARKATAKWAAKCKLMGSPWVEWDGMGEKNDYLHFAREFRQGFTECWTSFMKFKGHQEHF